MTRESVDDTRSQEGQELAENQEVLTAIEQGSSGQNGEEKEHSEAATIDYLDASLLDDIKELTLEELSGSQETDDTPPSDILSQYERTISDIAENQIIKGRVIGQNEKEIIMDIGFKSEGIIPRWEFAEGEVPAMGEVLEVYLETMEDVNGQTILSKEKADWMKGWLRLIEVYEKGETIVGKISRRIKGGMVVEVDGIQAFLPGSQIDVRPVQDFDQYLGQELEFKVVKVNQLRKNVVLSRKALLEDSLREQRDSLFEEIHVGEIREGRVKNITDFGAFVDLGGVDGLLHITDLTWGRVKHPSEVVEVGDVLTVKVIDVDREKQRISLGLKQLTPHPWEHVPEKYPVGTKVSGKVVSLTNYGAFVEIETGVEGLVHVSEMSWTRNVHHPSEVTQLGKEVEATVLSVNPEERKIALGFKQLLPDPWEGVEERYPVGSLHKGRVRNLTQFGAFVELEEGVDGLAHVSDLSWTKVVRHPREILHKGQDVEVRVLEVSRESRRIALGVKQATEDPWEAIIDHFKPGSSVSGKVIRSLDKGVIIQLEMDVEGIIPSRTFSRDKRREILDRFVAGTTVTSEVVEVKPDEKKVILTISEIPGETGKKTDEKEVEQKDRKSRERAEAQAEHSRSHEAGGKKALQQSADKGGPEEGADPGDAKKEMQEEK